MNDTGKTMLDGQIAYGLLNGKVFGAMVPLYPEVGGSKHKVELPFTVKSRDEKEAVGTVNMGNGRLCKLVIHPIGGPNLTTCWCRYEISEITDDDDPSSEQNIGKPN